MRIVQLLPTLSFGDAIGNDTIALSGALKDMGIKSEIYAENIDKRLPRGIASHTDKLKDLKRDVIDCAIALKQVVRTYNLVKS